MKLQPNDMGKWWADEIYYYTLLALTDEIVEIKQSRVDSKKLKPDLEIIYNQYTEASE